MLETLILLHPYKKDIFPCWKATFAALKEMKHESLDCKEDSPDCSSNVCCSIDDELQVVPKSLCDLNVTFHFEFFFLFQ
jgi:hypothetical protein